MADFARQFLIRRQSAKLEIPHAALKAVEMPVSSDHGDPRAVLPER